MNRNTVYMKKPSGMRKELWRESLPIGNGYTSALLCGSVGYEHFWVNRFDRWEGGGNPEIPDVSETLPVARELMEAGRYAEANNLLSDRLRAEGYTDDDATPMAPVEICIFFKVKEAYHHYRRGIDMDRGEAFVSFDLGDNHVTRRAFVSRSDDQAVLEVRADEPMELRIYKPQDERLQMRFKAEGDRVRTVEGDTYVQIEGAETLLIAARFDKEPILADYDSLIESHLPLQRAALGEADLSLCNEGRCNEDLLDEAQEETAPAELLEKLWRFGRYLFVGGTAEQGDPFPLYGLWGGLANLEFPQNVANTNVQMIYWHAAVGGYAELIRPLIHYYFSQMDICRDAARKLFGCRGIFISVYTTRLNATPCPNVPVIVNYVAAAGWLCQHFYQYYRFTGDDELLEKEILPLMTETAAFFEDYVVRDEHGKLKIIPSVSPENTPGNLMPDTFETQLSHPNTVVWNSTGDFAILKDLLTNLLTINETHPQPEERVAAWKAMLRDMPDYMVNRDGALREWMDERLDDCYLHRHFSHLYPLFPGDEIRRGNPFFGACEKALDLREIDAGCGWSFSYMSAMYARLGRAEDAVKCLDNLCKAAMYSNMFTLGTDWRDMGISVRDFKDPVQLDALLGAVSAMQEMLMRPTDGEIALLPACPARFPHGKVNNWCFPGGKVSFEWDRDRCMLKGSISAERPVEITVTCPDWAGKAARTYTLAAGETADF